MSAPTLLQQPLPGWLKRVALIGLATTISACSSVHSADQSGALGAFPLLWQPDDAEWKQPSTLTDFERTGSLQPRDAASATRLV